MRAASEMAGLRRMVEGMRQGMQALEDELFQAREERGALDMERAAAADEADATAAALADARARQADLVAAVDEVLLSTPQPFCRGSRTNVFSFGAVQDTDGLHHHCRLFFSRECLCQQLKPCELMSGAG